MGVCNANDPMTDEERAFTVASIQQRIEDEKKAARKVKK